MATQAYYDWDDAGRPWYVATPIKAVFDRLRAHGYTVYYLGSDDESHLQARLPEDHCPFSVTGWPVAHPRWWVTAADVMPPAKGQRSKLDGLPLPSLQQLGAQLVADRKANHPGAGWLKYINWEPQGDYAGPCYQDRWMPTYERRTSGDRGHIHASQRSDMVTSQAAAGYDLVARVRGAGAPEGDDMGFVIEYRPGGTTDPTKKSWDVSDGQTRRPISTWPQHELYVKTLGWKEVVVTTQADRELIGGPWLDQDGDDLSDAELAEIREAARQGALEGAEAGSDVSTEELEAAAEAGAERAIRDTLGGLDEPDAPDQG